MRVEHGLACWAGYHPLGISFRLSGTPMGCDVVALVAEFACPFLGPTVANRRSVVGGDEDVGASSSTLASSLALAASFAVASFALAASFASFIPFALASASATAPFVPSHASAIRSMWAVAPPVFVVATPRAAAIAIATQHVRCLRSVVALQSILGSVV